jgi:peptidoglycan/LPS O-acetylase OafA/YrhL
VLAAGILALYFELPVNVEVWVNGVIWVPALYLTIYGRVLRRFCSLKPVVWLGGMAMPIFLCDIPTKLVIRMADIGLGLSLDYSRPWVWLGHIALSLLVAWVFHLIFEKGSRQK